MTNEELAIQREQWLAERGQARAPYMALYTRCRETIERVFADAKENHGMRYTNHRGLTRVTAWVKLKFAP